jgi:CDP-diacylglycerol---serine O-phosphatidyltransferase
MVTFGVLPGAITYNLLINESYLKYIAAIIPVLSALRLAKFNIDTRQSESFLGVPTPANALFISAMPLIANQDSLLTPVFSNPWAVTICISLLALLLVTEIPLFSLKFKNTSIKENLPKYLLLIGGLVLFVVFKISAIPLTIILYILLSLFFKKS